MAATAPYTLNGTLTIPADVGQPNVDQIFSGSGNFTSKEVATLNLTGTGSKSVDLGSIASAGAKVILIKVDAGSGLLPILVKLNTSVTGEVEIAPGGFALFHNPAPVAGITALDIVYASAATVRITLLGD